MDSKTLKALKQSIKVYRQKYGDCLKAKTSTSHFLLIFKNGKRKELKFNTKACPLCAMFNKKCCKNCPIYVKSGRLTCFGTPFVNIQPALSLSALTICVKRELDFLISLLPKD